MGKNIAVFFDRDGTLIEEVDYLRSLEQLIIYPEAYAAVRLLNERGIKVLIVSNQSGVARGYFQEEFVKRTHQAIAAIMGQHGAVIDGFYFCPHHPDGGGVYRTECDCRKPGTGMFLQAARDMCIDLQQSFVVGDKLTDIEAGGRIGATGILVETGHGREQAGACDCHVTKNILSAVQLIVQLLDA